MRTAMLKSNLGVNTPYLGVSRDTLEVIAATKRMQAESERNGKDKITMEEIIEDIRLIRKEKCNWM